MRSPIFARGTAAALLASCAITPIVAHAQDAAEESVDEDGDVSAIDAFSTIVVTGTKTQNAENVQDVPLAVTAFNAQSLEAL